MINWLTKFFVKKITFPKIDASAVPIGRPQMPVPRASLISDSEWTAARIMAAMPKEDLWADVKPTEYADPYLSHLAAQIGPEVTAWADANGNIHWSTKEMTVTEENTLPTDLQWPTIDLEEAKKDSDRMKD